MKRIEMILLAVLLAVSSNTVGVNARTVQGRDMKEKGENSYVWKPQVKSVSVFKNGLGFFLRQGGVDLRQGWCMADKVPPATFGTLAIYSLDKNHLVDIVGTGPGEIVDFDDADAPDDADYKRRRLVANKNLKVELTYTHKGTTRKAAGKIVSVGPEYVILEDENNELAVPVAVISRMQLLDLSVRVHLVQDDNKPVEHTEMGMAYLRKGITWIPEYTVEILDDDTAEITLRGTLVNEAEDLIHCDVNFVVGVPHFVHTEYMAPVAVGQVIRTLGAAYAPRQVQTQIMNRAALVSNLSSDPTTMGREVIERTVTASGGDLGKAMGNLPQMTGAASNDYTVYTKKDMTIRRGEKAIVTIFVKKIKYSHIYRWTPPDKMKHFLVLHNDTDTSWTTGPYLAVNEGRPLSEDLLKYTPQGSRGEIPVTEAINIAHGKTETEINRKIKAQNVSGSYYLDLVTLTGELNLRNYDTKTVEIVISVTVPGIPVSTSDNGSLYSNPNKLQLTERSGRVSCRIKLEPGQTKIISYKYERYVRTG